MPTYRVAVSELQKYVVTINYEVEAISEDHAVEKVMAGEHDDWSEPGKEMTEVLEREPGEVRLVDDQPSVAVLLAPVAQKNGWSVAALAELFLFEWDELNPDDKSHVGIIRKSIEDADDPEWIRDMVSNPPR